MRGTTARWIALTLMGAAALTGCGDDGGSGNGSGTDEPVVVDITFEGGEVTPSGERVEVETGQPIDLKVTADEPGTLHLHSQPEQEFAYEAGTETFEIRIDRAGVIDVESHELDRVIVQLEVR